MKIKISKENNEIIGKIINDDNTEKDFSNLEVIDFLYKNDGGIEFIFEETVSENEQNKINEFYRLIKSKVSETKKEN